MMQVYLCGWFSWSAQTSLRFPRPRFQSGDTYTRNAVAVRGLSPDNTRRPHSKSFARRTKNGAAP